MIQANELRIGNYFMVNWSKEIRCADWMDIRDVAENRITGGVSGIPLSPEIIFSLGFGGKYKSCGYNFRKDSVLLTTQEEDDEGNEIKDYVFHVQLDHGYEGIYYLHQLQNLFYCLTGKELTYNPNQQ